ncbi:MAG: carboxypeptidase regulatory-like domain-containing protein [Anaerolineae bacterium]
MFNPLKGRDPKSVFALLGACLILLAVALTVYQSRTTLSGVVMANGSPVAGASVRIQGTANDTLTDDQGRFTLSVPLFTAPIHVTAFAPGYFIAVAAGLPLEPLALTLRPHMTDDNPDYAFISPVLDREADFACARCHSARLSVLESDSLLPVEEWLADAHSQSALNPRFLSLYNGTTIDGVRGERTLYQFDAAAGIEVPVAPSLGQAGVGAGFRLDFPDSAGSCATCHVPVLALEQGYNADPNTASGSGREGVTCDFCHKMTGVRLAADGQPLPGLTGRAVVGVYPPRRRRADFLRPL